MSNEEDDYMSMVIEEPTQKETFTQRKRREQREAEARGRVPSKAERAAQEAARRDEALAKSTLDPSNKGFQMMAKLGFKPGESLGKRDPPGPSSATSTKENGSDAAHRPAPARSEPLNLIFKEGRGGIGLDSEKKRKIREEAAEATKRVKQDEGDYRDRVREERETRRAEAHVRAAQKVAERLDAEVENAEAEAQTDAEAHGEGESRANDTSKAPSKAGDVIDSDEADTPNHTDESRKTSPPKKKHYKPTAKLNILYRGLVREREERERSIQARHALQTSLPSSFFPGAKLPGYTDVTLDGDDQQALGTREAYTAIVEQELEEEDPELDAFNALEPAERLRMLVAYLRDKYRYCFWCKYRYETDDELEGCPGLTEEDHD
ncbi:uncharacterized protein N7473_010946 [Penicillium subrubescens]|uniref:G patch domain-containing protein 11 n=1 Tax=Penicillium subrubescens TaxID=1316194 RepID=A0A1Q5T250_9EURO|nr:uncharacterized protein N7473_010946 [Penicillium subrubescens]KAJ5884060.1 hypothetical protein N7473_010946 [Penicillium subrubescens]OKO94328.1 G patch domain-containing protein 11 [Penicillium subrubescens]